MASSLAGSSTSNPNRSRIIDRIERDAGVPDLADILSDRLAPTDLQSLLLEVYVRRAKSRDPKLLLEDHVSNRFAQPSTSSLTRLLEWDRIAFSKLPKVFRSVELSPVCPLGTASVLSPISQDWIVSTIRNTEVVADSTNVLALECAVRRREQKDFSTGHADPVHLATSHRLLRGQRISPRPGLLQHFRLFSLCSAGRDPGNLRFETEASLLHIGFFLSTLRKFLGSQTPFRVAVSDFRSESPRSVVKSAFIEKLRSIHKGVRIESDQDRKQGRGYYGELSFKIFATPLKGKDLELVDGGDVNWTQKLLNNAKERLVISGCGSERVCELSGRASSGSGRRKAC
ncbi:MAG TPA: hypothetical protein VNA15_08305 [Candidatus Angelobacter sp.]|nr:hypothetical protein [Candidatus Angelobacter sp.]